MTLQNFEKHISDRELAKGQNYFENGCITELEEWETGKWTAIVSGSQDYVVKIQLQKGTLEKCSCDCPHDVDFCKHIIAVLYALQEMLQEGQVRSGGAKKAVGRIARKPKKAVVTGIVANVPAEELRHFVIEYAKKNSEFRNMMVAHFANYNDGGIEFYAEIIKNAAEDAGGKYGFIDYYNAGTAMKPVYELLEKATSALEKGQFSITADIAIAVIIHVHDMITRMDDSSGSAGSCITQGFDLLIQLSKTDIPYDLRERIFEIAEKEAKNKKYDFVDFDDCWFEVLVHTAFDQEKKQRILQLVDTEFAAVKKEMNDWSYEFNIRRLLSHKTTLLKAMGRSAEADELRLKYLHIAEFRKELIEELLQKKDYDRAKQLIEEGIAIAKKKQQPGTVDSFKEILLRIAVKCKDVSLVRAVAKELYDGENMEYYRVVKNTYTSKEWPAIAESFIKELQRSDKTVRGFGGSVNARQLASIFVEEGYWERLLELCQKNPRLEFVENYYEHLKAKFPEELLRVYKETLIEYAAQNTGRNYYVIIRNVLKRMQGWKGGREVVNQIIEQFFKQYKARKAMVEELEKLVRK